MTTGSVPGILSEETASFYRQGAKALLNAGIPFLVGGAYALGTCTGIKRHTKDFDIFVHSEDLNKALAVLESEGCRTEIAFAHWLAKAHGPTGDFIDLIFSSGNGIAIVDEDWFKHSYEGEVLGMRMRLVPPEEMIWSKAFILERERYDGADVAHLLRECAETLDWARLLQRFRNKWHVLLSHLILFGFIYPGESNRIPKEVMDELIRRLNEEMELQPESSRVCRGTLLSREQYLIDVQKWGYKDARHSPTIRMSQADIEKWTEGIAKDGSNGKAGH